MERKANARGRLRGAMASILLKLDAGAAWLPLSDAPVCRPTKAEKLFPLQVAARRNFAYAPFYSFLVTWSNNFCKSNLYVAVSARIFSENSI
jgi:hypothetical protein